MKKSKCTEGQIAVALHQHEARGGSDLQTGGGQSRPSTAGRKRSGAWPPQRSFGCRAFAGSAHTLRNSLSFPRGHRVRTDRQGVAFVSTEPGQFFIIDLTSYPNEHIVDSFFLMSINCNSQIPGRLETMLWPQRSRVFTKPWAFAGVGQGNRRLHKERGTMKITQGMIDNLYRGCPSVAANWPGGRKAPGGGFHAVQERPLLHRSIAGPLPGRARRAALVVSLLACAISLISGESALAQQLVAPSKPRMLRAEPSHRDIVLSWDAPSSPGGASILGYKIEFSKNRGNFLLLSQEIDPQDSNEYTHTDLADGDTLLYRVAARNSVGYGPWSDTATATIGVLATNNTVTATEDVSYTFKAADFPSNANTLASITLVTLPNVGTFNLGGAVATQGAVVQATSISTLTFTPAPNANGTGYARFTFTVNDGTTDSNSAILTINVTAVSDAPVAINSTVTATEGTAYTFNESDFAFTDVDGDALASITLVTLPNVGTFNLGGAVATQGAVVQATSISTLTFTPAPNANGTGYARFTFTVNDGTTDSNSAILTINVTAVSNPPSNPVGPPLSTLAFTSPSSVQVAENQLAVLTVTVVDPTAPNGAVEYSLLSGADRPQFSIDAATGALSFVAVPDYEEPLDVGGNNDYVVRVQATSGAGGQTRSAEQTITVTVTDVEEAVLEPGSPVFESGLYQQGQTTIAVDNTLTESAIEVEVTLPDRIVDANGAPLLQVQVTLADAPSALLPNRVAFGFDEATRVEIDVSPVPAGGVELCLLPTATRDDTPGSPPLQVLHFTGGRWQALPSTRKGDLVCASGVSEFSPFMVGYRSAASAVIGPRATSAWLARVGRTVTDQVLDAVAGRLAAPRAPGVEVRLAGQALPAWSWEPEEPGTEEPAVGEPRRAGAALRPWRAGAARAAPGRTAPGRGVGPETRARTGRDLVAGTAFTLTGAPRAHGLVPSVWGRGALTRFDGRDGPLTLDGEAATGLLGADWAGQHWTAGVALGHSRVTGGYRASAATGTIEAALTGVYPYVGWDLTERLTGWAAAGYGGGEFTLTPPGGGTIETDLTLAMGAAGLRGAVLQPSAAGGLGLAVKSDVRVTRTSAPAAMAAGAGRLRATTADVWRLRAGVEGTRPVTLNDAGATLTPSFEVGARLDGGDAETGVGADVGGGLALADPTRGLHLALKARALLVHEAQGFREWGASAAVGWDPQPATEQGLALALTQAWGGAPAGGMDALLARDTLAGLAGAAPARVGAGRLTAELGYGLAVLDGAFTGISTAGLTLTPTGCDYRLGWRLTPTRPAAPGVVVHLDATRSETRGTAPAHAVMLRGDLRF